MRDALQGVVLAFAIALGSLIVSFALRGAFGGSSVAWMAAAAIVSVRAIVPRLAAGVVTGVILSLAPALALGNEWTLADAPTSVLVMFMGATLAFPLAVAWSALGQRRVGATEAHHDGKGWVRVDGVPRFVAALVMERPGPVFVVPHDAARTATYRDDGGAQIFTVATHVHVASWAVVAIASVSLASAPLWIARVYGLL